jgi:hypothetical protein
MKIGNQETIKSIIQPEDKPGAVESAKGAQNTSIGIASVKNKFENAPVPNYMETILTQNQAETLKQNQAETLKPKPTVDQVLHWLNKIK